MSAERDSESASSDQLPDHGNLAVCNEHGIMTHARDERRACPACKTDVDVEIRWEMEMPGQNIVQSEVRRRLECEDIVELLPLLEEYLVDRNDEATIWITVERFDGDLPAGYSQAQERWLNVVGYEFGIRQKFITEAPNARETIETLRGEGYGDGDE